MRSRPRARGAAGSDPAPSGASGRRVPAARAELGVARPVTPAPAPCRWWLGAAARATAASGASSGRGPPRARARRARPGRPEPRRAHRAPRSPPARPRPRPAPPPPGVRRPRSLRRPRWPPPQSQGRRVGLPGDLRRCASELLAELRARDEAADPGPGHDLTGVDDHVAAQKHGLDVADDLGALVEVVIGPR